MTWPARNLEEISLQVKKALEYIFDKNSGIWFTTEWNICHHIAMALQKSFEGFDIDVELIKNDGRRPDIVIHERGNNERNLVIFQVKKNPTFHDIETDIEKITSTFFNDPYNYSYGIFISIGQLPKKLPEFDQSRIYIHHVHGWKVVLANEQKGKFNL